MQKISKLAGNITIEIYESKNSVSNTLVNKIAEGAIIEAAGDQLLYFTEIGGSKCNGSVVIDYAANDTEIALTLHAKAEATLQNGYVIAAGGALWPSYSCGYNLKNIDNIEPNSITIYKGANSNQNTWRSLINVGIVPSDEVLPVAFDYSIADPNTIDWKTLIDYGFTVGTKQYITVSSSGAIYTAGTADSVTVANKLKFNGRCVIFTTLQTGTTISNTVAHEFTHSLGIAHNCGYSDYKGENPCAMVYSSHWLRNATDVLDPWSNKQGGGSLCAAHIIIIRETNLENEGAGLKLEW